MTRPYMNFSSSTPMTFDGTLAVCFVVHLHNSVSNAKVKNIVPGVAYTFLFHQDAKGGHVFTWPFNCRNAAPVGREPGRITIHNFIGNEGGYLDANLPQT